MDKTDLQGALRAEAEDLDRTAHDYEKLLGQGTDQTNVVRTTAVLIFRGMAAAKRAAAAVLA